MTIAIDNKEAKGTQFLLRLPAGDRDRLATYVARENERLAPARLSLNAVIVDAINEYLDRHDDASAAPATAGAA